MMNTFVKSKQWRFQWGLFKHTFRPKTGWAPTENSGKIGNYMREFYLPGNIHEYRS